MTNLVIGALFGLCWGSFLNVVAYRSIKGKTLLGRSQCPFCKQQLAWYDLIPLLSWLTLRGTCRHCHHPISWLYPFIEVLTALVTVLTLYLIEPMYWVGYGIFFSALIITIRTDLETMLIFRPVSIGFVPIGFLCSSLRLLPLTPTHSILGALFGYGTLWLIAWIFRYLRNIEGLGEGDLELLAMIGSFIGPTGAWISLFLGSVIGSIVGIVLLRKSRNQAVPFGPWLSLGAIIFALMHP